MKRTILLLILLIGYNVIIGTFFIFSFKNCYKAVTTPTEMIGSHYGSYFAQDSTNVTVTKNNTSTDLGVKLTQNRLQQRNTLLRNKKKAYIFGANIQTSKISNIRKFNGMSSKIKSREIVKECDCQRIFKKKFNRTILAKAIIRKEKLPSEYIRETNNCSEFISKRGYIMDSLTPIEKEFPIAFSILMFKAVEQSERLLRAIYRPQNLYCIHVDKKSNESIFGAMLSIANCFDNVFLTSTRHDVKWGTMTVLEPDLQCMSELYGRSKTWKYFINLTGQEFPLKTNFELVKILQAYNGASDMEGTRKRANNGRWQRAGQPPHSIIPTKGSVHIVASRAFVEFVVKDKRAKDFLDWCQNVSVPDEVFFSSLQHNPHLGISGAYKGDPESFKAEDSTEKPFLARFKNWLSWPFQWPCFGKKVSQICIIGVEDLPLLYDRKELFVNKLYHDFQPIAYDCLEELHFNRTRDAYFGQTDFDVEWYKNLGFVKNRVP